MYFKSLFSYHGGLEHLNLISMRWNLLCYGRLSSKNLLTSSSHLTGSSPRFLTQLPYLPWWGLFLYTSSLVLLFLRAALLIKHLFCFSGLHTASLTFPLFSKLRKEMIFCVLACLKMSLFVSRFQVKVVSLRHLEVTAPLPSRVDNSYLITVISCLFVDNTSFLSGSF